MSKTCVGSGIEAASLDGRTRGATGRLAGGRLAAGLRLAAAPTFALMALLAGLPGEGGAADVLCLTAGPPSPFGGMVPMYLLMSAFHLPPWLALLAGRND